MGRPPSKLVTTPPRGQPENAGERRQLRSDYFTRSELVAFEQSWLHSNPGAGKEAFYRWYAERYLGVPAGKVERPELERVRQLFRDAKVRARKAGWLDDQDKG
jgi:hypothetical protein